MFRYLYEAATKWALKREPLLFTDEERLTENFISTGDGGFQVLSTPLHAVVLCLWFQLALDNYNAGVHFPRLRRFLGPLTVRYALTHDTLMKLDNNFFGSAIIGNARILSRDALNRFLLDHLSVQWFLERIGGTENLALLRVGDLWRIPELGLARDGPLADSMFRERTDEEIRGGEVGFKTVILQKIGTVAAKQTTLDVYNFYLQVTSGWDYFDGHGGNRRRTVVTVGNLNASGIA